MYYLDWGRYKIKPQQWGPLSEIRSAVFRNAERIGIDPETILMYLPFWESAGNPRDIIGTPIQNTNVVCGPESAIFSGDGYLTLPSYGNLFNGSNTFSVISRYTSSTSNGHTIFHPRQDYDVTFYVRDGLLQFGFFDGTNKFVTHSVSGNQVYDVCGEWDSQAGQVRLYVDGVLRGSRSTGTPNNTTGINAIGVQSTSTYQRFLNGQMYHFGLFSGKIPAFTAARLYETPYALIQPNVAPLIFDMGGGTSVSSGAAFPYDIRAFASSAFAAQYDIGATVNSGIATPYDILNTVSSAIEFDYDILNTAASSIGIPYDIRALVDGEFEMVFDVGGSVQADFEAIYDMAGRVFSEFTVQYDLGQVRVKGRRSRLALNLKL